MSPQGLKPRHALKSVPLDFPVACDRAHPPPLENLVFLGLSECPEFQPFLLGGLSLFIRAFAGVTVGFLLGRQNRLIRVPELTCHISDGDGQNPGQPMEQLQLD